MMQMTTLKFRDGIIQHLLQLWKKQMKKKEIDQDFGLWIILTKLYVLYDVLKEQDCIKLERSFVLSEGK